ncbi:MAG: CvpA family protein [Oscillospiraceae bacterium]|nr:CvpA family protein [Oscillospiraceae bacterium]
MIHLILDLLVLAVLAFCVWQGWRKGLILTAAGMLVIILAIWGANTLSEKYADTLSEKVYPLLSWVTDDATEEAAHDNAYNAAPDDENVILVIAAQAFARLGIVDAEIEELADRVVAQMKETGASLRQSIAMTFLNMVCRVLLFIFIFAVLALLMTLGTHFVSMLFKLPGLRLADTVGGLALGFARGLFILFAIGWLLRFIGILIPSDLVQDTVLLRLFVQHNPLVGLL